MLLIVCVRCLIVQQQHWSISNTSGMYETVMSTERDFIFRFVSHVIFFRQLFKCISAHGTHLVCHWPCNLLWVCMSACVCVCVSSFYSSRCWLICHCCYAYIFHLTVIFVKISLPPPFSRRHFSNDFIICRLSGKIIRAVMSCVVYESWRLLNLRVGMLHVYCCVLLLCSV